MIAAIVFALNLAQLWHDTNSHAATVHGVRAFAKKQYPAAAAAFGKANAIAPSSQRAFNLGTAEIAAGDHERGSAALQGAMNDARLRSGALFNRGNSALESKAYDSAIRDYSAVLRLQPNDRGAKRNLEIALMRKNAMQQSGGGSQPPQKGSSQPQPSQRRPMPSRQQQNNQSADEALLRSVQQQEQEELERMHRGKGERIHVGW